LKAQGQANPDVSGLLPPNLAAEGARVQSAWLFNYLHDPGRVKMRPWLTVRMPTFGFTDDQENTVIGYFTSREMRRPFSSQEVTAQARSLAVGGVVFGMAQCGRCHPTGPSAGAGASTAELAPSLLLASGRLRHDWVPSWIKDPQSWIPGTRMPEFFQKSEDGQYSSPFAMGIDTPAYAGQKAQLLQHFGSEAELKAYLADPDQVTGALRDYIWSLSGGIQRAPTPASPAAAPTTTSVTAGAAGGR
jgi:mono/diheme cytochrome c family protein